MQNAPRLIASEHFASYHVKIAAYHYSIAPNYIVINCWMAVRVVGSAFGFFQLVRMNIQVDAKQFFIQIPGSWSNLVVILLIFSSRYYFGYDLAVNPQHNDLLDYKSIRFASSGLLTGYLQGKLLGYFYCFPPQKKFCSLYMG